MYYPCAKFGDLSLSRFGFVLQTYTQFTDATKRLSHAAVVGVSNKNYK